MKKLLIMAIILFFCGSAVTKAEEKVTYNTLTELIETTFKLGVMWGHRLTLEEFNIYTEEKDKSGTTLPTKQTLFPRMNIERKIIEQALKENRKWIQGAKEIQ